MERDDIFQDDPADRSPLALDQKTLLNDQFRIGRVLGLGGFGITYLAFDEVLEMGVAVKEYLPNDIAVRKSEGDTIQPLTSSENEERGFEYGLERFLQEARTLAKFERHPNIVRVRTFFEENGTAYLVMNFYQGRTLADYLEARNGFISEEEALLIMERVLDGLRAVHEEDVLHRDIDPNNIYLAEDGTVVLLDFGAARTAVGERTKSMSVVLKRGYAPHEQYHSHGDQGPWTDVYATSATLYRAITGYKPPEAAARILKDDLAEPKELVPSLSEATNEAVLNGLAIRPENRPESVEEFSGLLPDPPDDAEPGWMGEPTSAEAASADTASAAELQVTATHACRLYVDGSLSTELSAGDAYTIAVDPGMHRVRAVRTDQANSGNATVTASGTEDVEEGSRVSLDSLMWQGVVSTSENESTTLEIDFEEEGAAEAPSDSTEAGRTEVFDDADEDHDQTVRADDTGRAEDEAEEEEGTPEPTEASTTPADSKEADEPEKPVRARDDEEPQDGVMDPDDETPTEEAEKTEAPPPGRLQIQSDRAAQLFVDGERKVRLEPGGEQDVALAPGQHQIRAEAIKGTDTWEDEVVAEAGATRPLQITLDTDQAQESSVVSSTLLYGGAGVLVLLLVLGWWLLRGNQPPAAAPDRVLASGESIVVDVLANDRDPDQDQLRVQSAATLADSIGQAEVVDSTRLRIEPAPEFAGLARVGYVVADATGDTAHAQVTLRVPFNGVQQAITRQADRPQDAHAAPLADEGADVAIAALGSQAVGWVSNSQSNPGHFDSFSGLETSENGAVDVHTADLTGNGRSDVLSASLRADAVTWYENQGDSTFGEPQRIATDINGPVVVQTGDVDNDGTHDVIAGAFSEGQILWYENQGNGQFGPGREIASGVRGLETLHVADLDNDDVPDLLSVSYPDSTVRRYEPTRSASGSVRFETGPSISVRQGGPIEVHTADVTDNGREDVLIGTAGDSSVVVVENRTDTTGTLQFGEGRVLSTDVKTVEGIDTGDVEGDGTLDVFAGSFDSDTVVWFKNEGEGHFRSAQTVATGVPDVLSLEVADVNGDNTPDVLAASQSENMVAWYENHLR